MTHEHTCLSMPRSMCSIVIAGNCITGESPSESEISVSIHLEMSTHAYELSLINRRS